MEEATVGPGLGGNGTEIPVGNGKVGGQSGDDGKLGGTEGLHNLDGNVGASDLGVVNDEAQVWPLWIGAGRLRPEELISDVVEGLRELLDNEELRGVALTVTNRGRKSINTPSIEDF